MHARSILRRSGLLSAAVFLSAAGAVFLFFAKSGNGGPEAGGLPSCRDSAPVRQNFSSTDNPSPDRKTGKAVAGQFSGSGREKMAGFLMDVFGLSPEIPPCIAEAGDLMRDLFDESLAYEQRRSAAWRLSRFADREICAGLKRFLTDPAKDSALKALIAEGLGESAAPQAEELILYLLENGNEIEVCGAVRGLAARGTDRETDRLAEMLSAPGLEEYVQDEMISALGRIQTPKACSILTDLYARAAVGEDVLFQTALIESLSQKDISQTADFFNRILSDPATDPEIRRAVAEALGAAEGETAPVLAGLLSDPDADVRIEAAWGLIRMDLGPETIAAVSRALQTDDDPLVRKYLYEALSLQDSGVSAISADGIDRVFEEESAAAQTSGFQWIASRMNRSGDAALRDRFDEAGVPVLIGTALGGNTASERIQAATVLARAGTERSEEALITVVAGSTDPRVIRATGIDLSGLMERMEQ